MERASRVDREAEERKAMVKWYSMPSYLTGGCNPSGQKAGRRVLLSCSHHCADISTTMEDGRPWICSPIDHVACSSWPRENESPADRANRRQPIQPQTPSTSLPQPTTFDSMSRAAATTLMRAVAAGARSSRAASAIPRRAFGTTAARRSESIFVVRTSCPSSIAIS